MSLTHEQRQGSLIPVCVCSALIGWFIGPSGGLKTVGWLKQITKERVCWHRSAITTVMATAWKHRCILPLSLFVLHLQSFTCLDGHPADRWVRDTEKETDMMFYLDVVAFDLPWPSNLWLLKCSAQRLLMHFSCVVHQDRIVLVFFESRFLLINLGLEEQAENPASDLF